MDSVWKGNRLLEMSTFLLSFINVALPGIAILPIDWRDFENDPLLQIVTVLGFVFGGHILASVLFSFIAYRLRRAVVFRWIVFFNALLVLGSTSLVESMIIYQGMPDMSGVWFGIAPMWQMIGILPALICLVLNRKSQRQCV